MIKTAFPNRLFRLVSIVALLLATAWAASAHENPPTPEPTQPTNTVSGETPSFEQIRPILEANCVGCHTAGEFGHDSFSMDTADEITEGAEDIALVVRTGFMPPWPPGDLSPEFLFERGLTDDEIQQIVAWAEAGAPSVDDSSLPMSAAQQAEPVVEADRVLSMSEPYAPNQERDDDYRCFLLDPGFTEDTFIVGYDILPDNTGIVHHTVLFPGTSAQRAEADALNGADGQPGWECFGGTGLSSGGPDLATLGPLLPVIAQVGGLGDMRILLQSDDAVAQLDEVIATVDTDGTLTGMIAAVGGTEVLVNLLRMGLVGNTADTNQPVSGVIGAWVPGSTPTQFPENTGLLLPAGGFIIMQMHYNTQANTDADQSQLVLDLADETDIAALRVMDVQGPVEIPCPEGVSGEQCSRDFAIERSGAGADALLAICGQSLDQYAAQDPTNARTFCDYTVPSSGWAVSILSHQHRLGETTRTILKPDTPEEQILIDIPAWDFDWQGSYWFAQPVWLNEGDTIRLICTWDNSVSESNPEPHYVVAGEGTSDEMCLNFITMLPAEPGTPMPVMAAHETP
jgi:mono/diheme cytochrome c family protein